MKELINFKMPYSYTTLCAFFLVRTFDERDYIEIDKLDLYRKWLLEKVEKEALEDYKNDRNEKAKEFYSKYEDVIFYDKVSFDMTEDINDYYKLASSYPEIFSIKDNKIYLSNIVTLDDLESVFQTCLKDGEEEENLRIFTEFDFLKSNIPDWFYSVTCDNYDWIKILDVTKFGKLYNYFCNLEKEIESKYYDDIDNVPFHLLIRLASMKTMYEKHKPMLEHFDSIVHEETEETIPIDSNFDEYNSSRYIKNKEKYPIDYINYRNSEFYEDTTEINNIQDLLIDNYQYAIFGRGPLYKQKVDDYLDQIYMGISFYEKEEIDQNQEIEIDCEEEDDVEKYTLSIGFIEEEFAFYNIYLHKLDEMIENGYQYLKVPRQRLLYVLDDTAFNLTIKKNLDKWYNWACNFHVADEDTHTFQNLGWEAGYFVEDIFDGEDYRTTEKLLFVSTYYEITKDKELIEVLDKYKDYDKYDTYSSIILGDEKGYPKRKNKI